jgi:hypothetical protein
VTAHHETLRDLDRRVSDAVSSAQMAQERADADRRLSAAVSAVTDACASRRAVQQLQAAQEAGAEQLVALQGVVSTKVDRADLLRLQVRVSQRRPRFMHKGAWDRTGTATARSPLRCHLLYAEHGCGTGIVRGFQAWRYSAAGLTRR